MTRDLPAATVTSENALAPGPAGGGVWAAAGTALPANAPIANVQASKAPLSPSAPTPIEYLFIAPRPPWDQRSKSVALQALKRSLIPFLKEPDSPPSPGHAPRSPSRSAAVQHAAQPPGPSPAARRRNPGRRRSSRALSAAA